MWQFAQCDTTNLAGASLHVRFASKSGQSRIYEYTPYSTAMGVPCRLGAGGLEEVLEITLNDDERAQLNRSADAVRELIGVMLESFGIPKAPVDLALDYRLNPADKVLTLSKLEIGLQGQGTLSLSLILDGVSDKASEAAGAKDTASLRSASLVYTDVGLLSQLIPAVAKQQGMCPVRR